MLNNFCVFEELVFFDFFLIPDSGFRIPDSGFRIPDSGSGFRFRNPDSGFWVLGLPVFEDLQVRSRVVHLVFHSQTLEQLGVFENVRVINDHYIFEEHLMHH